MKSRKDLTEICKCGVYVAMHDKFTHKQQSERKVTSETSHTPGPWSFHKDSSDDGYGVAGQHPGKPDKKYTLACVQGFSLKETEANARLIASAPELLALLKEAKRDIADIAQTAVDGSRAEDLFNRIEQVIAKAEEK